MGKQPDGVVDILFPDDWITIEHTEDFLAMLRHLGAHEAVHATIHHIGDEPFDVHQREEFAYAPSTSCRWPPSRLGEHLAEYLANEVQFGTTGTRADVAQVKQTFEAWQNALDVQRQRSPRTTSTTSRRECGSVSTPCEFSGRHWPTLLPRFAGEIISIQPPQRDHRATRMAAGRRTVVG